MFKRGSRAKYAGTAFLAAMVLTHCLFFWNARHLIAQRYADFTAFYAGGEIVRSGNGHQLYDLELQTKVEREKLGRPAELPLLPFLRPAYEALLFVPFACLPYLGGFTAWNAASVLLVGIWIRLMRRQCHWLQQFPSLAWWGALLGFFPVFINLPMGQDSILLLLLVTLAWINLRGGSATKAGVWLGVAMFKPQIVVALVLLLLLRPQRVRLLCGFLLGSVAVVAVSVGVGGWHGVWQYPRYLLDVNRALGGGTITPADMPNLRGMVAVFSGDGANLVVVSAMLAVGIGAVALLARGSKRWLETDEAFSIALVAALLLSYHTHVYDLALLILPIALRVDGVVRDGELRGHWLEAGAIALLFLSPIYMWLVGHMLVGLLALVLAVFAGAMAFPGGSKTRDNISPSMGI